MRDQKLFTIAASLLLSTIALGQSKLKMIERVHDFGMVIEGDKPTYLFEFENVGTDTLMLENVRPSCGCTAPNWPRQPFLPGESGEIRVTYNSQGRVGAFHKHITVTIKGEEQTQELVIKGVVVDQGMANPEGGKPALSFSKSIIQLGNTELNRSVKELIQVTNNSKETVKVLRATAGCYCVATELNREIAPGKTISLEVTHTAKHLNETSDKFLIQTSDDDYPYYQLEFQYNPKESLKTQKAPLLEQNGSGRGFGF